MRFTKMHGTGNDYVFVDGFRDELPSDPVAAARIISNRHTGIGSDGMILIVPSASNDARMRMFNADGSESEMCGNGIRCVAKYLFDHGYVQQQQIKIETGAGVLTLELFVDGGKVQDVRVDMGSPVLLARDVPTLLQGRPSDGCVVGEKLDIDGMEIPVTCISMGNPHCIVYTDCFDADVNCEDEFDRIVREFGPRIEMDSHFPSRVNVEFVRVLSRSEVRQRTWERGSGETLACGTGASAVCVAGVLTGRTDRTITCHLTGGDLQLEWDENTGSVFMTGPAVEVFHGEIDLSPTN